MVEPDLLVADFGSNAEFTCNAYLAAKAADEDQQSSQGEEAVFGLTPYCRRHFTVQKLGSLSSKKSRDIFV